MLIVDDARMDAHAPGPAHPERPARLIAARRGVSATEARREAASEVALSALRQVHTPAYVDAILATSGRPTTLDPDTHTSEGSVFAARLAAGAAMRVAESAANGEHALALCRPPGHHAMPGRAMGFCLFNNVAVAAQALAAQGVRAAIFDPDVHHGNGTEAMFWERGEVLFTSMHRYPFYPGTGAASDVGAGAGLGATLNVPMPLGAGDDAYLSAMAECVLPALERFDPDIVLISAGFDALAGDPLGGMTLTPSGMAAMWAAIAARWPIAAVLEGGYHLDNLTDGLAAVSAVLTGGAARRLDSARPSPAWAHALRGFSHPLLDREP